MKEKSINERGKKRVGRRRRKNESGKIMKIGSKLKVNKEKQENARRGKGEKRQ